MGVLILVVLTGCGSGGAGTSAVKLGTPAAGRYSGKSSQGRPIVLIVSPGGRSLSYLGVEADWRCSNGETGSDTVPHSPAGVVPLKNGTFRGSFSVPRSGFKPVYRLLGSYTNGSFAGTIQVTATPQNGVGSCASGTISWTASPPLTGATGTSTGGTSTG